MSDIRTKLKMKKQKAISSTLRLERVSISQLNPAAYNPRVMSKEARDGLRTSLQTFSYVEPIIWNKRTGNIVGGHQRYSLLIEDGVQEVDVVVVDLDDAHEKALNVTLNNQRIRGEFSTELLQGLLADIQATGFDNMKSLNLELVDIVPTASYEIAPARPNVVSADAKQAVSQIVDMPLRPPPKMAWVLIGTPLLEYGRIQSSIEAFAKEFPDVTVETAISDKVPQNV